MRNLIFTTLGRRLGAAVVLGLLPLLGWGQATIASQDFETTPATPTVTFTTSGGAFLTGSSASGEKPASSPFFSGGARAYSVTGTGSPTTATLISSVIDVNAYTGISVSFRLAAFQVGTTTQGLDAGDNVKLAISTNGGTTYSEEVLVNGSSNANWPYSTTGVATTAHDGDNVATGVQSASGSITSGTGGISTVSVTGIPATSQLRVRITMLCDNAAERWTIDDVLVRGTLSVTPTLTVTPTALTRFTYAAGSGPSDPQSYSLSGINLTPGTGNITITPPTGYEVSLSAGSGYVASPATLLVGYGSVTSGTLAATTIFVRLKSGLSAGSYNSQTISNAGGGATAVNVTASGAVTAAFTSGNILVSRVGDGSTALGTVATLVDVLELSTTGTAAQAVPLPATATASGNRALTLPGDLIEVGQLGLSNDGRYVVLGGLNASSGTAAVAGTTSAAVARVVGRLDQNSGLNSTTALADVGTGGVIRAVASADGSSFYASTAEQPTPEGVRYVAAVGATTSTQLITASATNTRFVAIADGQLYFSSSAQGVTPYTAGGTPTTSGQTRGTSLTGTNSPYGFVFLDLDPAEAGADVLYAAVGSTIAKYSKTGSTWTSRGTITGIIGGANGITASGSEGAVVLYATTPGTVFKATDAALRTASASGTATSIATAGTNYAFRGVAFAPAPTTITSFAPTSGPVGTSVAITGTNFTGATAVSFNGTAAASFVVNSATRITAIVASGTTTGLVTVATPTSPGGVSSVGNFTVTVLPTVTTDAVSPIAQTTATANGTVTAEGTASVTERGVYFSTTNNFVPPGAGTKVVGTGTGLGSFTASLTGLLASTTYYVVAYATSTAGTSFGAQVSFTTTAAPVAVLTELIVPQNIAGRTTSSVHTARVPYAFRVTLSGLSASTAYRYYNAAVTVTEAADNTSNGVGNPIFVPASGSFVRTTTPGLSTAGNYGTLTTDAGGSYTGWFVLEPTGDSRFADQATVRLRINLNDGAGGTAVATRLTTTSDVTVRQLGSAANQATGLYGNSFATARNFALTYDNEAGTGRPLAATFVESDGTANVNGTYADFYADNVDGVAGAYGLITPNTGVVRRLEQRDLTTGLVVGCPATAPASGVFGSGVVTLNPSGGTSALALTALDAPLTCTVYVGLNPSARALLEGNSGTTTTALNVTMPNAPATDVTVQVTDSGSGTATAGTDYTFSTQSLTFLAAGTYPQTQTVSFGVLGDALTEGDETAQLALTVTSGGPATVLNSPATITITDDDNAALGELLLEDDFSYSGNLTSNGWTVTGSSSTNPVATIAGNVVQPSYPRGFAQTEPASSTASRQAQVLGSGGQDVSRTFTRPAGNTVFYTSAVVSVSTASSAVDGNYFFHLIQKVGAISDFRGKLFTKAVAGGFNFGLSVASNAADAVYSSSLRTLNTPYLVVLKYEVVAGAANDRVSLYIFDVAAPRLESSATVAIGPLTDASFADVSPNAVALRQDAGGTAATVDGVRVGTSWGATVGRLSYTAAANTLGGQSFAGNYFDLLMNGPAGAVLGLTGGAFVEGELLLTQGNIVPTATNFLTLREGTTVTGGSATSFVSGPLRRITASGAATTVFPIGKGTAYRPLTLNTTAQQNATTYTAEQFNASARTTALTGSGNNPTPLTRVSNVRYFNLTPLASPGTYSGTVTLTFDTDDLVNYPADASFVMAKRSTSAAAWGNFGRTASTGTSNNGNYVAGTLTSGTFISFSDFSLASTAAASNNALNTANPLPVELTSFQAQRQPKAAAVTLKWATASEKNSAYFEVQRSLNGETFAAVATVVAQGSRSKASSYTAIDASAPASQLYYRLRQVDADGTAAYSPVVVVNPITSSPNNLITLYPNPARESISFAVAAATPYRIVNMLGQSLLQGNAEAGEATVSVAKLPAGSYYLELQTSTGRTVRKFVKE